MIVPETAENVFWGKKLSSSSQLVIAAACLLEYD
jgi:hypothetical protein